VPTVALALGANLLNPKKTFASALDKLSRIGHLVAKSQLYDSEPEGPEQPRYLNAVILLETDHSPSTLLALTQSIEAEAGRDRSVEIPQGPRPLDIDLILYGPLVYQAANIEIPHPKSHLRRFVLMPLADIAPDWVHPTQQKTIKELLDGLSAPLEHEMKCLGPWPDPEPA
jgi:2-amino-4-hydroxy-6-hydroxymethyldihydropteridine diphosphokinase